MSTQDQEVGRFIVDQAQQIVALQTERGKLRDLLASVAAAVTNNLSLVEFYAKREMESPSNGEEAVRETREQLREYRKAEETLRAELERLRKEAK